MAGSLQQPLNNPARNTNNHNHIYGPNCGHTDYEKFLAASRKWQTTPLKTSIRMDDSDFADLYHLRRGRKEEFAQLLGEELAKNFAVPR